MFALVELCVQDNTGVQCIQKGTQLHYMAKSLCEGLCTPDYHFWFFTLLYKTPCLLKLKNPDLFQHDDV